MVLGQFSEDVLASIRAVPSVLTDAGFVHQHPDVRAALQWALTDSQ
jgi:NAD dependent epimerase/dehydratase family enzyme